MDNGHFARELQFIHQLSGAPPDPKCLFLARDKFTKSHLAVKIFDLDQVDPESVHDELQTLRNCHHPNIIKCISAALESNKIWFIFPAMTFGSTWDLIQSYFWHGLPLPFVSWITFSVLCGLNYLHRNRMVHRSLASSHILVNQDGSVKICGLSHAYAGGEPIHTYPASLGLFSPLHAPEVFKQNLLGYSAKCDIYSLGITLCELINGFSPYHGLEPTRIFLLKVYGEKVSPCSTLNFHNFVDMIDQVYGKKSLERAYSVFVQRTIPPNFLSLVEACQNYDPDDRPSAGDLLRLPLLQQAKQMGKTIYRQIRSLLYPVVPISSFVDGV